MGKENLTKIFNTRNLCILYIIIINIWMYSPLMMIILFSFNTPPSIMMPFHGFEISWYIKTLTDKTIIQPLLRSLQLAVSTMLVVIGITTTMGLALRHKFKGRDIIFYFALLGLVIPGISMGMGTAFFYNILNVKQSIWTTLPLHVVWSVPFGLILLLVGFDPELLKYEQAARTLGAGGFKCFKEITLPLIWPQILAAGLFGFTLSLGELMRSIFVTGAESTLPIYLYGIVTNLPPTPKLFALGTIIITISFVAVISIVILMKKIGKRLI